MSSFCFSYGQDPFFPYQDGWTEVKAPDQYLAVMAFEKFHPKRPGSRFVNCALIYTEREWEATQMAKTGSNFGHGCHELITLHFEHISDTYEPESLWPVESEEKLTFHCEYLDG